MPLNRGGLELGGGGGGTGNQLLYGSGVPSSALGNNGDSYVDTVGGQLYGPKTGGAWPGTSVPLGGAVQGVYVQQTAPAVASGLWVPTNPDESPQTTWKVITTPPTPGNIGAAKTVLWCPAWAMTALADGNAMPQLNDISGNLRHLLQATVAKQPVFKTAIVNGQPVARFTASPVTRLAITLGAALAQPYEVWIAFAMRSDTAAARRWIFNNGANGADFSNGTGARAVNFSEGSFLISGSTSLPLTWHVWRFIANGASSSVVVDGTQLVAGNAGAATFGSLQLGASLTDTFPADIDIGEVAVFNAGLTTGEASAVLSQARTRYGTP